MFYLAIKSTINIQADKSITIRYYEIKLLFLFHIDISIAFLKNLEK